MTDMQITPEDAEMNHEKIVGDFFAQLDEGEAVDTPDEPEVEPEEAEDEDSADESEPSVEGEEATTESEDEDDELDEEEPEAEADEEETWEKRYKDQQAFHDQRMAEVQQQLENMNTWAQQVYEQQVAAQQAAAQQAQSAQPANPLANVTREALANGVESDLVNTFRAVAEHRPDLVAVTIATARDKHGNEIADQMQLDYNQYIIGQEREARQQWEQQAQQERQAAEAPMQIQETMNQIVGNVAQQYGEAFESVREEFTQRAIDTADDFKEYMQQNGYEMTPDAVHHFLVSTFNDVREEKLNAVSSKPRKARRVGKADHIETSTTGDRPEDMTADDRVINEILMGARELNIDTSTPTR